MSVQRLAWKPTPTAPELFHITHLDNLSQIVTDGGLWSDADIRRLGRSPRGVAHQHIKDRRLKRAVPCHAGTFVGEYVPFFFCPRSVMLYAIHCGHPAYPQGDQTAVVHLVVEVASVVRLRRKWAFTSGNASTQYVTFHKELVRLPAVEWDVMNLVWWQESKEERQAEFLLHEFLPWPAVREIAVHSPARKHEVEAILAESAHRPDVSVRRDWYY